MKNRLEKNNTCGLVQHVLRREHSLHVTFIHLVIAAYLACQVGKYLSVSMSEWCSSALLCDLTRQHVVQMSLPKPGLQLNNNGVGGVSLLVFISNTKLSRSIKGTC